MLKQKITKNLLISYWKHTENVTINHIQSNIWAGLSQRATKFARICRILRYWHKKMCFYVVFFWQQITSVTSKSNGRLTFLFLGNHVPCGGQNITVIARFYRFCYCISLQHNDMLKQKAASLSEKGTEEPV